MLLKNQLRWQTDCENFVDKFTSVATSGRRRANLLEKEEGKLL